MSTYHIAAKQESRNATDGLFYTATLHFVQVGANDNFILSSEPNGVGNIAVDDVIKVIITDREDSTNSATYLHDFGEGGRGITPIPPVNLNEANPEFDNLRGKQVRITIEFSDKYGGAEWCSDIYVTLR